MLALGHFGYNILFSNLLVQKEHSKRLLTCIYFPNKKPPYALTRSNRLQSREALISGLIITWCIFNSNNEYLVDQLVNNSSLLLNKLNKWHSIHIRHFKQNLWIR